MILRSYQVFLMAQVALRTEGHECKYFHQAPNIPFHVSWLLPSCLSRNKNQSQSFRMFGISKGRKKKRFNVFFLSMFCLLLCVIFLNEETICKNVIFHHIRGCEWERVLISYSRRVSITREKTKAKGTVTWKKVQHL